MGIWKSKNPPPSATFHSRKSQNNTLTNTRGKSAKYEHFPHPNLTRNLWESGQNTPKYTKPEVMYKMKCVGTTGNYQEVETIVQNQNQETNGQVEGEIERQQPPILVGRNGPPDLFYPTEVIDEQKPKPSSWKPPSQDKKSSIYAWLEQSERAKQAAGGFLNESKQTIKWDDDEQLELQLPNPQPQTSMSIPVPALLENSVIILDPPNLNKSMPNPVQSPVSNLPQNPPQNNNVESVNQNPETPPIINHTTDLAPLDKIKRQSSQENVHKEKDKEKTLKKNTSSRKYPYQNGHGRINRRYHHGKDRITDGGRGERRKNIDTDKAIKDRILSALHGNREYYKHLRNSRILTDNEREKGRDDDRKYLRTSRKSVRRDVSTRRHEKLERDGESKKHNKNKNDETEEEDEEEELEDEEEDRQRERNTRPSTSKNYKRKVTNRSNRDRESRLASRLESDANITEKNIKSIAQLLLEGLNQANKKYSKTIENKTTVENNNNKKNEPSAVKPLREIDNEKELRKGGNSRERDKDSSRKKLNFNEALARHISKSHLRFSDFPPFESRTRKGERERERDSSSENENDTHSSSRSRKKKKIVLMKKSNLKKEVKEQNTRVGNTKVKNGHRKKGGKSTAKESEEEDETTNDDDDDELNNSPSLTDIRYLPVFMTRMSDVPVLENKELCHRLFEELNDGNAQGDVQSNNVQVLPKNNVDGDEFPLTGLAGINIDFSKVECHFTKKPLKSRENLDDDDDDGRKNNKKKDMIEYLTVRSPLKWNANPHGTQKENPIPKEKSTSLSSVLFPLHKTKQDMDFANQSLRRTQPTTDFSFHTQNSLVTVAAPKSENHHTQTQVKSVSFPQPCQDQFKLNLINFNKNIKPYDHIKHRMHGKTPTLFSHKSKLWRRQSKNTLEKFRKNDKMVFKRRSNKKCQNYYGKPNLNVEANLKIGRPRNNFLQTKTRKKASKHKKFKSKSNNSLQMDIIKHPPIHFFPVRKSKIPILHQKEHEHYKNGKLGHQSHNVQHEENQEKSIYVEKKSTQLKCLYAPKINKADEIHFLNDDFVKSNKRLSGLKFGLCVKEEDEIFCKGDCDVEQHQVGKKSNSSIPLTNNNTKNNFELNKGHLDSRENSKKGKDICNETKKPSLKSILKPANQRFCPSKYKCIETTTEQNAPLNLHQNSEKIGKRVKKERGVEMDSDADAKMRKNKKDVKNMGEGKVKSKKTGNNKNREKGKRDSEKSSSRNKNGEYLQDKSTFDTSYDDENDDDNEGEGENSTVDSYSYSYSGTETRIGKKTGVKTETSTTKKTPDEDDDDCLPKMTTTEGGGICFKLPGRVTHKTSIKVAHYPRQEAVYVNVPCSCYPGMPGNYYCPMPCQQPPELMNNCNIYNYGEKPYGVDNCGTDPGNVEYLPC